MVSTEETISLAGLNQTREEGEVMMTIMKNEMRKEGTMTRDEEMRKD